MTISMYRASIPVMVKMLGSVRNLLEKGAAHAEAKKFDPAILVNARLCPDMFPLSRQVQIASDAAKGCGARLAGIEAPKFEDTESSFPELLARVDKTVAFLQTLKPEQIDGSEGREIVLKTPSRELHFNGEDFLRNFALPNFFFHITMTYALLRENGVDIGKMDYLGLS